MYFRKSFNSKFKRLNVKYKKDPKKVIVLGGAILGLFSMLVGSSYAYLVYSSKTNNSTVIRAGTLALDFKNQSNSITLSNSLPISDSDGLNSTNEYEFTVSNNGSISSTYKITLDNVCTTSKTYTVSGVSVTPDKCVPNDYIKVGLKSGDGDYKVLEKDNNNGNSYILDVDSLVSSTSQTYKLKIWLDYDTPNEYNSKGDLNILYVGKLGLSYEQGIMNLDKSGANPPVLSQGLIPVYYDSNNKTWNKADSSNSNEKYKWYDYDNKMWANSVTYDHTKAYDYSENPKGVTFDGVDDYIDMGNASYNFGKTITYAARFKITKLGTAQHIISNVETAGVNLIVNASNKVAFAVYGVTAKAYKNAVSTTVVEANKWYTAVGTYDGSTVKLYINGKLETTLSVTDTIKVSTQSIFLGANPNASGTHQNFLNGTISDAAVIKATLSASDISSKFSGYFNYSGHSNQVFYKTYGNKDNGTLINATYDKEGALFNGDGYINAGNANYNFGDKVTIAARFKVDKFESDQAVVSQAEAAGVEMYLANTDQIRFNINFVNAGWKNVTASSSVDKNRWYTVVGTYDGSVMKLYIDGELSGTLEITDTVKISTMPFLVGANPNKNNEYMSLFNGTISNAVVLHDVLSESEIKSNYSSNISHIENDNTLFYYDLKGYEYRAEGSEVPMDIISTMQVWIPRYKYKVWNYNSDGTVSSPEQQIAITFESDLETTGDINCTDSISGTDGSSSEVCKVGSSVCTDNLCNGKTYTHPAFTFGTSDVKGFWVSKFEVTGSASSIYSKPNMTSLKNLSVSDFHSNILKMKNSGNLYNFLSSVDTHMIKNSEWGAVAYLSNSKYGLCSSGECTRMGINNNSSYLTGCGSEVGTASSTTCNSYNTALGMSASTTGNVYGIYDMSGGSYEKVMGDMVYSDGKTMISGRSTSDNSGFTGIVYDSGSFNSYKGISYPNVKYYDKYSYGTSKNQLVRTKLGDGVREIVTDYDNLKGWYNTPVSGGVSSYGWSGRGGSYSNILVSNIFYAGTNYTGAAGNDSTHFILIP